VAEDLIEKRVSENFSQGQKVKEIKRFLLLFRPIRSKKDDKDKKYIFFYEESKERNDFIRFNPQSKRVKIWISDHLHKS
jgi:hypothetical protein